MAASATSPSERMRALNDQLRQHRVGGKVVMTRGIASLGEGTVLRINQAVRTFDDFGSDNDPYREHDFGRLEVEGHTILFKIHCYDLNLQYASLDPTDPSVTCRVMTVMLVEEY